MGQAACAFSVLARTLCAAALAAGGLCLPAGAAPLSFAERDAQAEEAERALERAWREAETQFGASPETARAAYDFARASLIAARPEEAREAVARLGALEEEAAAAGVAAETLRLAEALAAFDTAAPQMDQVRALARATAAAEQADPRDDLLIAAGWLQTGLGYLAWGRPLDAYPPILSGRMLVQAAANPPELLEAVSADLLARAAIGAGRYEEAAENFFAAAALFSPVGALTDGDDLPVDWVTRATQAAASNAALRATGGEPAPYPAHSPRILTPQSCSPDWRRQRAPRLDYDLSYLVGAVLVEMRLGPDGRPRDVAAVAAAPRDRGLEEIAIDAAEGWRARDESAAACGDAKIRAFIEVLDD